MLISKNPPKGVHPLVIYYTLMSLNGVFVLLRTKAESW